MEGKGKEKEKEQQNKSLLDPNSELSDSKRVSIQFVFKYVTIMIYSVFLGRQKSKTKYRK